MLKTDRYFRDLAQDALKEAGFSEPPLDMREVSESVGVPVRALRLPSIFSGALVYEDGLPVFIINATRDDLHQRATLAHLLGHVIEVLRDEGATYPRGSGDHRVANVIGAELILPEYMVVEQARLWFNDHRYLARLFGVTEGEILAKMKDLGLIKDRGIRWDY